MKKTRINPKMLFKIFRGKTIANVDPMEESNVDLIGPDAIIFRFSDGTVFEVKIAENGKNLEYNYFNYVDDCAWERRGMHMLG